MYEPNTLFPSEFAGLIRDKKLYLVSIGQSIEVEDLAVAMSSAGIADYTQNNIMQASEAEPGSIVFAVVGCSIKALSESGMSRDSEIGRADAFIRRAGKGEITLVSWHTGGVARRGSTSDALIEAMFGGSNLALFTAAGNDDLRLSDFALAKNVPYCQFVGVFDMLDKLSTEDSAGV